MTTTPPTFNLEAANAAIGGAIISLITLTFRDRSTPPDDATSANVMTTIRDAITSGSQACAEVKRLRDGLTATRDQHRPHPSSDPANPEPRCHSCSLTGVIVPWPCTPWSAAERLLMHDQH